MGLNSRKECGVTQGESLPICHPVAFRGKEISDSKIRRGSQVVHLDRIVGNVLPGSCLKTNSVVRYYSFLYPKCKAVFVIGS